MEKEEQIRKVNFYNSKNQKLVGILHENNKKNIVIICHGITGCKNHNFIPLLSNFLEKNNFSILRFDFTGNGDSEGKINDGNYTQEIDDLGKAIDFVKNLGYKKISLIGHSMGGAVSILRTSKDSRINNLISIVSPGKSSRFREKYINTDDKRKQLNEKGHIILKKNNKKLTKEFFEDVEKHNVINSVKKIKVPFLIIHGEKDETVPIKTAKLLYENANEPKSLEIIKEADHYFGYKGIYKNQEETKEYKQLKQKILQFLKLK